MPESLKRTPLYESHLKLKARMVPFAGYEMPVQYTGLLEEAKNTRLKAGLFDVSHMGQFTLKGTNTLEKLQKLVTNDLSKMKQGQAQYNMLCNNAGGVIDDLVVYFRSEKETFICVNASNRDVDFAWMKEHLKTEEFKDISDETALIAIQGPEAEAILMKACPKETVLNLKYYWAVDTILFGKPCLLSRTGYTGEDGFEIYIDKKYATEAWEKLLEAGQANGIMPVGLGARDTLRLEMGYPLHGHEISDTITPLEANLGWVVKLEKTIPFFGQQALQKEKIEGSRRTLKAFIVEDRRIARGGFKITTEEGTVVGEITSGTHSPHVNAPIALGFVDTKYANALNYKVQVRTDLIPMKVTTLPFVPSHVKKNAPKV